MKILLRVLGEAIAPPWIRPCKQNGETERTAAKHFLVRF